MNKTVSIQLTDEEFQALFEIAQRAPTSTAEKIFIKQVVVKAQEQLRAQEQLDQAQNQPLPSD